MWNVTHGGGWTFSENFSLPAHTVWDRQLLKDSEWKDDAINYKSAYRTALATPSLLIICLFRMGLVKTTLNKLGLFNTEALIELAIFNKYRYIRPMSFIYK